MNEAPESKPSARFDPIEFAATKPMARPAELAVAFGQLIDSIGDLTGVHVARVIVASLSAISISWDMHSVPSLDWLSDVEEQLSSFAACAGVQVHFRRH